MQISGKGTGLGFLLDMVVGTFPMGTIGGALMKNLLSPTASELDSAYDRTAASKNSDWDFGDLAGMARGLLGRLDNWLGGIAQPQSNEEAAASGQPRVDPEVFGEAQQRAGISGGKLLLYGGIALAGISILKNTFFGCHRAGAYGPGIAWC